MSPQAALVDDDYELVDAGDAQLWSEWAALLTAEGWTSLDRPCKALVPTWPTIKCVFARRKSDGAHLSSVVWNENRGVAWIATFLTSPHARGLGLGTQVWQRAMDRIEPTGLILGLCSVKDMVSKYKSQWTPFECGELYKCKLTSSELNMASEKIREKHADVINQGSTVLNVKESEVGLKAFLELDKATTYCDRADFWKKTLDVPQTEAFVLLGEKGQPLALGAVSKTGHDQEQTFKLGPLFASHLAFFACIVDVIAKHVLEDNDSPIFLINLQNETAGDDLQKMLKEALPDFALLGPFPALYSREYTASMDRSLCIITHADQLDS